MLIKRTLWAVNNCSYCPYYLRNQSIYIYQHLQLFPDKPRNNITKILYHIYKQAHKACTKHNLSFRAAKLEIKTLRHNFYDNRYLEVCNKYFCMHLFCWSKHTNHCLKSKSHWTGIPFSMYTCYYNYIFAVIYTYA